MITFSNITQIICSAILVIGLFLFIKGLVAVFLMSQAQRVPGTIIDNIQEYTARGFVWKAKVQYVFDDMVKFYITKAKTMKRGTDTIMLYITKGGMIIEKENVIRNIVFGVFIIAFAIVAFFITRL